jgi:hypothetical protein
LDSRTKIKWMIFTVLIPEYILGKALNERPPKIVFETFDCRDMISDGKIFMPS